MKQLTENKKLKTIVIILIILAGIIMVAVKGFNFDLKYKNAQSVELYLQKEFNDDDIKSITNEVFGKQKVMIQKVEVYENSVLITTSSISDEQKNDLITKINEKYETELKAEDINVNEVAHTQGRDIIKPYIQSFAIVTAIILVYFMIRYYKQNPLKVLIQSIGIIGLAQILLLGIMVIARIPVSIATIPLVLLVYMISTYICTSRFEKNIVEQKN